jgi:hypothetical protein
MRKLMLITASLVALGMGGAGAGYAAGMCDTGSTAGAKTLPLSGISPYSHDQFANSSDWRAGYGLPGTPPRDAHKELASSSDWRAGYGVPGTPPQIEIQRAQLGGSRSTGAAGPV